MIIWMKPYNWLNRRCRWRRAGSKSSFSVIQFRGEQQFMLTLPWEQRWAIISGTEGYKWGTSWRTSEIWSIRTTLTDQCTHVRSRLPCFCITMPDAWVLNENCVFIFVCWLLIMQKISNFTTAAQEGIRCESKASGWNFKVYRCPPPWIRTWLEPHSNTLLSIGLYINYGH